MKPQNSVQNLEIMDISHFTLVTTAINQHAKLTL